MPRRSRSAAKAGSLPSAFLGELRLGKPPTAKAVSPKLWEERIPPDHREGGPTPRDAADQPEIDCPYTRFTRGQARMTPAQGEVHVDAKGLGMSIEKTKTAKADPGALGRSHRRQT